MRHGFFGAAMGVALTCFALNAAAGGVSVGEASKDQLRAAEKTFHVADDLFDAKRFQEALTAYRASYDIVASPNSQLMVARCLIQLGRLAEAHAELEAAIESANAAAAKEKKYANTARAVQEELSQLNAKVGRLSFELAADVPPDATLTVAGKAIERSALERPVILAPGRVKVVLSAPDGRELRREIDVAAGKASSVRLALPSAGIKTETAPAPKPKQDPEPTFEKDRGRTQASVSTGSSSLRTWAYVAGGVGIAGFATFGIFGAMSQSKFDSLEADCTDGHCPPDRRSDIDNGRRFQTFANVGLAVGIVGVGTGTVLFFLSSGGEKKRASERVPWIAVGAREVTMGGRF